MEVVQEERIGLDDGIFTDNDESKSIWRDERRMIAC